MLCQKIVQTLLGAIGIGRNRNVKNLGALLAQQRRKSLEGLARTIFALHVGIEREKDLTSAPGNSGKIRMEAAVHLPAIHAGYGNHRKLTRGARQGAGLALSQNDAVACVAQCGGPASTGMLSEEHMRPAALGLEELGAAGPAHPQRL